MKQADGVAAATSSLAAVWEPSLISPKVGAAGGPLDSWYRYYAGYSADFVQSVLSGVTGDGLVLDPWNGTGTTTVIAARAGRAARGFDANPALVVVAKARLLGNSVAGSIGALTDDIVGHASAVPLADDPLRFWFDEASAAQVRGLQTSTDRLLVSGEDAAAKNAAAVDSMSSLAAFFYVALFRTVRLLAAPAAGTNPTWWKRPAADQVLSPGPDVVKATFRQAASDLQAGLHGARLDGPLRAMASTGDSRSLPLEDNSVGAAVTSPPYCTRIDYAVATRPELAVLRADEAAFRSLRDLMVGTPTITGERGNPQVWGPAATKFLEQVSAHESRASATYYAKYFTQYYAAMWDSLNELRRVCQPEGTAVLVVQDSHYKEVHNDTPGILLEMAKEAGFDSRKRHDFPIPRTKAAMNPRARAYRKTSTAVESVLVLS